MNQCKQCGTSFATTPIDEQMQKHFDVPPAEYCFDCSQKRLLCFRNGRTLYHRTCDFTGENIISIFAPHNPHKAYKAEVWYSDKWDPYTYGRNFDFSRPFFEQFKELQLKVPRIALSNIKAENSDYCNSTYGNTNCYLIFGGDNNKDCMYGSLGMRNKDTVDCDMGNDNELCYEISSGFNCYNSQFVFDSKDCVDCAYIADCIGCSECVLCTNLIRKTYCIENKQYAKEEYLKKKKQLLNGSNKQYSENLKSFKQLLKDRIVKFAHIISCEDSTGDYLKNCKSCINTYDASESWNLKDVIFASMAKDCPSSAMLGDKTELAFRTVSTFGAYNTLCSFFVIDSSDIEYCDLILNSKNMFGCVGINKGAYSILNKRYAQEEFKILRKKIINHMKETDEWGQFFPPSISPFGYNETTAFEYYQLSKKEAAKQGFKWEDNTPGTFGKETLKSEQMQDNISEIDETINHELLACKTCNKNYKIIKQEFLFYKKLNIPIPQHCPDCRYKRRLDMKTPRHLWERQCMCALTGHGNHANDAQCPNKFETAYSPERPEKVFCEACYQKEVL